MFTINGEEKPYQGMTVLNILRNMNLDTGRTAVMICGEILPKSNYNRELKDGDEVDIVGFVGGG